MNDSPRRYLMALDQGTTSSRAVIYDEALSPCSLARKEFTQYFPRSGWVEHDADEIFSSTVAVAKEALDAAALSPGDLLAIGITNQRETVVVWERDSGRPVQRAIVWQDRRTDDSLAALESDARSRLIQPRTGLLADPYFSASKIRWILDHIPDGQHRAENGELATGTVDSWLIHCLTGGRSHVTDVSNASRTMLMNLTTQNWDADMLELFGIPRAMLPEIRPSSSWLGETTPELFGGAVPITSAVGDQQSALFGQLCNRRGQLKCTYGTGCFLLAFTGESPVFSSHRLVTTVAWKIGDSPTCYALEGSVFIGGAAIQWLRDGLRIISSAADINPLAESVPDCGGVVFVPAFTGLGAPYWDPDARGTLLGISRGTHAGHIARATLAGIAHEVADVVTAMGREAGSRPKVLRVDGGASASDLLMQNQADLLGIRVERPADIETTALGAAMLAGLGVGLWESPEELQNIRRVEKTFLPSLPAADRLASRKRWRSAVRRSRNWTS
ncbi:MAG: glycerol kinase GlpK [Terrimicrobiaceae bacterium]